MAQLVARVEGLWRKFEAQSPWLDLPLALIDFETTGFDEHTDRIVEIGVALFRGGVLVETKSWLIQPDMAIPESAVAVHGITDDMVANAPRFAEVVPDLLRCLEGCLPAAYNQAFDRKFLHAELMRARAVADLPAADPEVYWVDPLVWVRELLKEEKSKKLSDVCEKLGIPLSDAHRAWADAEAAGRVLYRLAADMPRTYSELIRIQTQYGARQEAEFADWRRNRRS